MEKEKKYEKPKITRIKLNAGEAVMTTCSSSTQRTIGVKNSYTCATAAINCRNPVS